MDEKLTLSDTGMMRANGNKLPVELVPPEVELLSAAIYGFGAVKYDEDNWRKGGSWRETIGSLKRHLRWFEMGEDFDPDSGLCHLLNMSFNINTLIAFWATNNGTDDRYKLSSEQLEYFKKVYQDCEERMNKAMSEYEQKRATVHNNSKGL